MPLPNVSTNINNVSMDYFLRGVEAAKPQGVQAQGQANVDESAPQEPRGAGKLVAQLDVLLLKAAKASTQSLTGKTVKQTFQKLVDDGALGKDSLKLLGKAADAAAKTLKALDKFTGQQLAAAFDAEGKFDATTKVGKAIRAAVEAQQNLSDLFAQLGKNLDAIDRHYAEMRQANPQFKGVDAALRNEVDEMRLLCDRRATEINHLAYQMKDFAAYLAANGQNAGPNVVAILKAKVNDLMPRQALAMHGTADALATVSEEVSGKLRPLAEKIDAFRQNPSTTINTQTHLELQSDISTMKAAIADIRKNGIAVGGGRMMVAGDVMKALEKEVAKAEKMLKTARKDVAQKVLTNYLKTTEKLFTDDRPYEYQYALRDNKLAVMLVLRNDTIKAMKNLRDAVLGTKDLGPLINDLRDKGLQLWMAADKVERIPETAAEKINKIIDRCQAIAIVISDFVHTVKSLHEGDWALTGSEAMGVFEGKISVSSLVEARARGLESADVDPANEDANIVSERKLGSGISGSVYELQRRDGTSVVFKGETESRTGLNAIAAGNGKSYAMDQQTINLNIASKNAAVSLGMSDIIVNYSAGTHKGTFGFFMEKAKGLTGKAFAAGKSSSAPGAGLSANEIRKLPTAQRRQIKADLMRELNRMQWLDLVVGQNDRHWDNYFIHVDRETHKVTVKGVDNDASYSQSRTGAVKYTFDKSRSAVFKQQLKDLAKKIDSHNVEAELDRLLHDPGIAIDEEGQITVDASKLANKAISQVIFQQVNVRSLALPDKIDRKTYASLMALKQDPARKAYLDSIRPRLSEASYNAAVSRLDDVIAHAEKLGQEGKIVEENGWMEIQEQPLATGKVSVRKQNGDEKQLGGNIAEQVNDLYCPSYFARDKFDKLF